MKPEQLEASLLTLFRKFKEHGVEVVYGAKAQGRYFLAQKPAERVQASTEVPTSTPLTTEEELKAWLKM